MRKKKVSFWRVIAYGLRLYFKHMPLAFIIFIILGLAGGLSQGFTTFIMHRFFDSVENAIGNRAIATEVYLLLAAVIATLVAVSVFNGAHTFLRFSLLRNKTRGLMCRLIHAKAARIDPIKLEDTHYHDDMEKAADGTFAGVGYVVCTAVMLVMFYLPYFIFMGFYLHHLNPLFIFAIVLVFVPIIFGQFIRTGIISKFTDETAPVSRELGFYQSAVVDRTYFKETRLLGAFPFFFTRLVGSLCRLGDIEWKTARKTNLLELCTSMLSAIGYGGIILMLVFSLLAGDISVGAFAAVFTSIGMMFNMMESMVSDAIGRMSWTMAYAANYIRFMDMPERGGSSIVSGSHNRDMGIVAENIHFTYPGGESKSVENVSLYIPSGETIAIVGENGAGKTTLVRLLLGLYRPDEGTVHINGMDTATTNMDSLFKGVSGVFQRFQQYEMTLKDNVQISDIASGEGIDNAIKLANVHIGPGFNKGEDTMLSREYGGVDLSGGEWQRVAIARGLYRAHNIVVLDEPTAAIDPLEESRIYNQFVEISKGKTAIIVTHRLGSTKIADRVIVMDKGKVVDIGTHHELLQREGLYAKMFNSQAGWYEAG